LNNDERVLEPVTLVISETVQPEHVEQYEQWVVNINQAVKQFSGFLGVDVIRPREKNHLEYVVIVRFDTYENLNHWQESKVCHHWIEKARDMVIRETQLQHAQGLELWFTLPKISDLPVEQPAYYKLVVVGILAVYPLVLLVNLIIGPLIVGLPYLLNVLISVIAISALITYPVMPGLTRLLNFWLYPSTT